MSALPSSLVKFSLSKCNRVGVITLSSPDTLNALTFEMGLQFRDLVESLNLALTVPSPEVDTNVGSPFSDSNGSIITPYPLPPSTSSISSVVITGEGRCFSAGGSMPFLKSRGETPPHINSEIMYRFYKSYLCIRTLPVPVMAAINGPAVGAGACLTLACDYRVMSPKAFLSFNFLRLGIHPGMGGTHFLPTTVGYSTSKSIMLSSSRLPPPYCLTSGLVDHVHGQVGDGEGRKGEGEPDGFLDDCVGLAREWGLNSPVATRGYTRTMREQQDGVGGGLERALWREADQQAVCYNRKDWREGLEAVMGKREPEFDGFWTK